MTIRFGTDGWRSLMSDSFNVKNVKKVAQAVSDYINEAELLENGVEKSIVIGYDTRANSDTFAKACAEVMAGNGIKVFMPERALPTPLTAYAIKTKNCAGALMITASHNPAVYNGIKFIPWYAGPATEEITAAIERNLESVGEGFICSPMTRTGVNPVPTLINPIPAYTQHLADKLIDIDLLKRANLKVLANPMFGAAYGIFADLLRRFGCQVDELDGSPDSQFGGLTPEPIPRNLTTTIRKLKNDSYDMVLALDGDADRFGIFDSNGTFIQANYVLALIADYLVSVKKLDGAIVRSVATTHFLDNIAVKNEKEIIETPVGFKYIGQIMREKPVVIGGEESAGLSILNHIPEKDGLLANLLIAEIAAYYKKPLSELVEDLFQKYGRRYITKRLDLELEDASKKRLMDSLKIDAPDEIAGIKVDETIDIDGLKFILEEGSWLLARPSGTESIIRIYLEADNEEKLDKLENFAKSLI